MLGLISLAGIVVNNSIMLVDFANAEQERGKDKGHAIAKAVKDRIRPILATSLTTVAGLLPLALSTPFWESLAFTIVFGLVSSTVLIILVLPNFYYLLEKLRFEIKRLGMFKLLRY